MSTPRTTITSETEVQPDDNASLPGREISPNRGASQADSDVIKNGISKADWLTDRGVRRSDRIMLRKLAHIRYQSPDLRKATVFMQDFGMKLVGKTSTQRWFGGYGPDHYVYYVQEGPPKFLGGTFEVESYQDLEKVARLSSAKVVGDGIREMTEAPGGGQMVSVTDPEGFPVNFIFGQTPKIAQEVQPPQLVFNYETLKPRARKFQRFEPGPAPVYKLGHFGLVVSDFPKQMDFYTSNFNITPSDILYVDLNTTADQVIERKEVAMFAHIDRGQDLVDHHTLFLTTVPPGVEPHVHHCSFEIHDFDTQALGHQWLADKGYESVWGIGRHILGSQIFDYWWGPDRFMVEHYADGDLVNEDTPLAYGPAGHEGLAVWGPEVPISFLE